MEENRTVEQNTSRDFVALGLVKIQFPSERSKCENFFVCLCLYMLSGTQRFKIIKNILLYVVCILLDCWILMAIFGAKIPISNKHSSFAQSSVN